MGARVAIRWYVGGWRSDLLRSGHPGRCCAAATLVGVSLSVEGAFGRRTTVGLAVALWRRGGLVGRGLVRLLHGLPPQDGSWVELEDGAMT